MENREKSKEELINELETLKIAFEKEISDYKRSEIALQRSEEKFRRIVETSNEGILSCDSDNVITFTNQQMAALLGYSIDEMLGQKFEFFLSEDELSDHIEQIKNRKQGKDAIYERLLKRKDGEKYWLQVSAKAVMDSDGKFIGFFAMFTDINARKLAEKTLLESEHKYRELVESSPDAIAVYEEGKIIYANQQCIKLMAVESEEDLLGKPVLSFVHAEYREKVIERIEIMISEGGIVPLTEERFIRPDGSEVDVEVKAMSIRLGNKPAVQLIIRDITERKLAALALRHSDEKFRRLVETSNEGILTLDSERRITFINQQIASMLGYTIEEMLGRTYESFITAEQIAEDNLQRAIRAQGKGAIYERCFRKKDGTETWTLVSAKPLLDAEGKFEGSFGMFTDITERKRTQAEIQKKNRELAELNASKDKFFSIIAHDLKNPLGTFKDVTKLLAESYHEFSEEDKLDFLKLMKESSSNIYSLLENLLDWSRSQRGTIPYNPVELNLKMISIEIIKLLKPSAEKKRISIENNISAGIMIQADVNMLNTVIRNLLSNAIKFTPIAGKIAINAVIKPSNSLNHSDGYTEIYIKDSGIGMKQESSEKLFRIDTQLTTLGTNSEKGTGLGLILCKEFVEKHGGKIWVESEVNIGSTFYFTLPISSNSIIFT